MTMTVLEEMTKVMLAVPGPQASDADVAAWYELKAHLLEHIAAEGGPDAEENLRQAALAHRRSAELCARQAQHDATGRSPRDLPDGVVHPFRGRRVPPVDFEAAAAA
ncbi:MAG TPA: hypothetical protein VFX16_13345 [Pseudonocardiaceae bacterium]|nr:hypothetical protein [Pseudonocardiaceae bacterium]